MGTALSFPSRLPAAGHVVEAAAIAFKCLLKCTSDAGTHQSTVATTTVCTSPGALASVAFLARSCPPHVSFAEAQNFAHALMVTFFAPASAILLPSFLDAYFTLPALCSVPYGARDAARLISLCTTPLALQFLTVPPHHGRVCSAATLAHLATLDERFVGHLADDSHLETLLGARLEAATAPDDAAATTQNGGCSRTWHTTALLTAVDKAARACRVAAPAVAADD